MNELWSNYSGWVTASSKRLVSAKTSAMSFSIRGNAVASPGERERVGSVESGSGAAPSLWGSAVERLASVSSSFDDGGSVDEKLTPRQRAERRAERRAKDSYQVTLPPTCELGSLWCRSDNSIQIAWEVVRGSARRETSRGGWNQL